MTNDSCWQILGIEPTNDEAVIKKAYAKQLKHNKPDKNPDGFRQLRSAYEQALETRYWYDFADEEETDDKQISVTNTYNDSNHHAETTTNHDNSNRGNDDKNTNEVDKNVTLNYSVNTTSPNQQTLVIDIADININVETYTDENSPFFTEMDTTTDLDDTNTNNATPIYEKVTAFTHWQLTDWQREWQNVLNNQKFNKDQHLYELLTKQIQQLKQCPLDEQNDFEEQLLSWFAEQPAIYPDSYQFAKSQFGWDKYLNHWQHSQYPWYQLEHLNNLYQHFSFFQSPANWLQYLASHYPDVYQHWHLKIDGEFRTPNRWLFFNQMLLPYKARPLAEQLKQLNDELQFYQQHSPQVNDNNKLTAKYWQQHPQMQALQRWVFGWFIRPIDFGLMAGLIAIFMSLFWVLAQGNWLNFSYDSVGIFVVLTIGYIFWQLQFKFFANLSQDQEDNEFKKNWLYNSSILAFVIYTFWLSFSQNKPLTDNLYSESFLYFLANLAGLNLFLSMARMQNKNIFIVGVSSYFALFLVAFNIVIPFIIVISVTEAPSGFIPLSPFSWLLPIAPIFLTALDKKLIKISRFLSFIDSIGYFFATLLMWSMFVAGFMLFIYSSNILPNLNFGFTGLTIIVLGLSFVITFSTTIGSISNHP
ncbi:hypothetical protein [Psychrobacter sp. I-STPA6b]|uniref:hypothetical protein n=1 Tax=Psychrobacter sp. I-STPA6b TaxID=2585718 RepID=UPI001D0C0823|nr:hypothetical protein [Psychrobacter sp. I-STPA6b]